MHLLERFVWYITYELVMKRYHKIRVSSPLIDEIFVFKDHIHIHFHSSISSQSES